MRYVGIRDDDIPKHCSIKIASEILDIHPNTLRGWIKRGKISSIKLGRRNIIDKYSIIDLMVKWRYSSRKLFKLSVNELLYISKSISEILDVTIDKIDNAYVELQDYHYISIEDEKIFVQCGYQPKNAIARILYRMLSDNKFDRICPYCEKIQTGILNSKKWNIEISKKLYKRGYTRQGYEINAGFRILCESRDCVDCKKRIKFLRIIKTDLS
jgi:hypothetical protein